MKYRWGRENIDIENRHDIRVKLNIITISFRSIVKFDRNLDKMINENLQLLVIDSSSFILSTFDSNSFNSISQGTG